MKLVRHGPKGNERPGIVDAAGNIRDLSGVCDDFTSVFFAHDGLRKLRDVQVSSLPVVGKGTRLGACIAQPGNFIAIGLNYVQHARETNAPIPTDPILFNKAPSCISGPFDPVVLPKNSTKTDWEVELALVIGKEAHCVDEASALDCVAGYCVCNDVSEREFQIERGGQWMKGKGAPTFGPLGPWLVTTDEIKDPQKLDMWLTVNGETRQMGSTKTMIFPVSYLVWYCSQFIVMEPGDVIITGTPPGVALGMKPQKFLKIGDVVRLRIDGLGEQEQKVVKFKA